MQLCWEVRTTKVVLVAEADISAFSLSPTDSCFLRASMLCVIKFTRWLSALIVNCVFENIFISCLAPRKTIDFSFRILCGVSCPCFLCFSFISFYKGESSASISQANTKAREENNKNVVGAREGRRMSLPNYANFLKIKCKNRVLYLHECCFSQQGDYKSWHQKHRCHIDRFLFHRKIQNLKSDEKKFHYGKFNFHWFFAFALEFRPICQRFSTNLVTWLH